MVENFKAFDSLIAMHWSETETRNALKPFRLGPSRKPTTALHILPFHSSSSQKRLTPMTRLSAVRSELDSVTNLTVLGMRVILH